MRLVVFALVGNVVSLFAFCGLACLCALVVLPHWCVDACGRKCNVMLCWRDAIPTDGGEQHRCKRNVDLRMNDSQRDGLGKMKEIKRSRANGIAATAHLC